MYHHYLQSDRLFLRYYDDEDLAEIYPLFSDLSVRQYYLPETPRPQTENQVKDMLKSWHDEQHSYLFSIIEQQTGKAMGLINFDNMDWQNRNAEIGIGLANKRHRGKGYASEAMGLLIEYGFDEIGLHRIYARVIDGNKASHSLFSRLGFQQEGLLREHVFRHGQYRNMYMFGLLRDEWIASR
ncbi:MAG TPA: GNAT family N-acetyltransferase [Clostridiaceae bacterium]|nr:GNAT family N-acetyltransferase [Clostridiaceae bacterium]